ncbi:hypothetical protein SAMN05519105_2696 [Rhodobacter sp. 24-YEA-8]|nr:hypothetical protein SAMN05519105_2696 [Rhodobacter sp. 24-YEA-8]
MFYPISLYRALFLSDTENPGSDHAIIAAFDRNLCTGGSGKAIIRQRRDRAPRLCTSYFRPLQHVARILPDQARRVSPECQPGEAGSAASSQWIRITNLLRT